MKKKTLSGVDINNFGDDFSKSGIPKSVTIVPGQTVTVDIDIDTGFR